MTILRCTQNLKLDYDIDEKAASIIDDKSNQYVQGCFWREGELYEVNGYEESALLTHYPEYFQRV